MQQVQIVWIERIRGLLCKKCKYIIGESAMNDVSKCSKYSDNVIRHFYESNHDMKDLDTFIDDNYIINKSSISSSSLQNNSRKYKLTQVLQLFISKSVDNGVIPITFTPSCITQDACDSLEIHDGWYCPAAHMHNTNCSFATTSMKSLINHMSVSSHNDGSSDTAKNQIARCKCKVQKAFGGVNVRVKSKQNVAIDESTLNVSSQQLPISIIGPLQKEYSMFMQQHNVLHTSLSDIAIATSKSRSFASKLNWNVEKLNRCIDTWKDIRYDANDDTNDLDVELHFDNGIKFHANDISKAIDEALDDISSSYNTANYNLKHHIDIKLSGYQSDIVNNNNNNNNDRYHTISFDVEPATYQRYYRVLKDVVSFIFRLSSEKNVNDDIEEDIISSDIFKNAKCIVQKGKIYIDVV